MWCLKAQRTSGPLPDEMSFGNLSGELQWQVRLFQNYRNYCLFSSLFCPSSQDLVNEYVLCIWSSAVEYDKHICFLVRVMNWHCQAPHRRIYLNQAEFLIRLCSKLCVQYLYEKVLIGNPDKTAPHLITYISSSQPFSNSVLLIKKYLSL